MKQAAKQKIFFILLLFLLVPLGAQAIDIKFNVDYPSIPAPVPGGKFDLNCVEGKSADPFCTSSFVYAPTIGNAVVFIFIIAIWVSGIIAFISLIYAGYMYIISGANAGMRIRAKERLTNVLWGIAILLLATLIINTINTDIAGLRLTGSRKVISQEPKERILKDPSPTSPPTRSPALCKWVDCSFTTGSCKEGCVFGGSCPTGTIPSIQCTTITDQNKCGEATVSGSTCVPGDTNTGTFTCVFDNTGGVATCKAKSACTSIGTPTAGGADICKNSLVDACTIPTGVDLITCLQKKCEDTTSTPKKCDLK